MDVSENNGTPNSSILIGFSTINHPFWGAPIFGHTHMSIPIFHTVQFCHFESNKNTEQNHKEHHHGPKDTLQQTNVAMENPPF